MQKKTTVTRSIIPLGDKVLLKELQDSHTSDSGIMLPDSVGDSKGLKEGKVIEVGEGSYSDGKRVPLLVQKNDVVLYSWGEEISIDGNDYVLVRESEISAKIK